MYLDKENQFSDAQALTATAASTNVIDLGHAFPGLGNGGPIDIVIAAKVGLAGTTPTFKVQLQQDDAEGFASPTTILESQQHTSLPTGSQIVMRVPPGAVTERFVRLNYVLGGTTPTVTVTSGIVAEPVQNWRAYADAI